MTPSKKVPDFSDASIIHATCVAVDGKGVLLKGKSGSGKSDVALRLIDRGHQLVSDDQVKLTIVDNALYASAPENIAGMLEIRGLGIINIPYVQSIIIDMVVELADKGSVERMPSLTDTLINGISISHFMLYPFEQSAPLKIERLLASNIL